MFALPSLWSCQRSSLLSLLPKAQIPCHSVPGLPGQVPFPLRQLPFRPLKGLQQLCLQPRKQLPLLPLLYPSHPLPSVLLCTERYLQYPAFRSSDPLRTEAPDPPFLPLLPQKLLLRPLLLFLPQHLLQSSPHSSSRSPSAELLQKQRSWHLLLLQKLSLHHQDSSPQGQAQLPFQKYHFPWRSFPIQLPGRCPQPRGETLLRKRFLQLPAELCLPLPQHLFRPLQHRSEQPHLHRQPRILRPRRPDPLRFWLYLQTRKQCQKQPVLRPLCSLPPLQRHRPSLPLPLQRPQPSGHLPESPALTSRKEPAGHHSKRSYPSLPHEP